ncbi:hypothetical protein ZOD2009_15901 [Haladaptatus paucihalophilus DX253]|uniref:Uncharacterized protein n=1 Tax=Haladaptatus paucihalophilus DX253 TaxID=797209 RepID=E7QWJ2_HALPU|nr:MULTISPECIES: hypothetical protein [Haladaptatus]EFW91088.1 hypothetical protein ZOD2009_15901 [Haladaptatus paucihalophilus DX253]GKZ15318.1 hypothetical protein HAL_31990 [Haladaptatus sp. T7]SHL37568.1 hypothetical protein SAMN05444342_3698 [Haladaptatus paucihalophilus DX253]
MDALGEKIIQADALLWHISNVGVGIAVFVATLLYSPPGTNSLDVIVTHLDLFYLLISLSLVYTCWTGIDLWKWFSDSNHQ